MSAKRSVDIPVRESKPKRGLETPRTCLEGHCGGSTKGALTCGFLKALPISVPSADEQQKIVTVFQTPEDKQALAASKQSTLQELFRTLLHELMSANIRVHLITISAITGKL